MPYNLDDPAVLAQDGRGMLEQLARFPEQCREALALGRALRLDLDLDGNAVERVVFVGMGGSGIAGDLLRRFLRVPVEVVKGDGLPPMDGRALLIAVSYSGNTQETLGALEEGLKRGMRAVCLSSGGRLEQIATERGLPWVRVPAGLPPRLALGYLALPPLRAAAERGLTTPDLQDQGWDEDDLPAALEGVRSACQASVPQAQNAAKRLAQALHGTVPLIYGTYANTAVVAQRWKCQINENAKQPAFWHALPELNHNEIVQFTDPYLFSRLLPHASVLLLRNEFDRKMDARRIGVLRQILEEKGIPVEEVPVPEPARGRSALAQVLSQIYLGDWVSAYLALLNGLDPTPVALIEQVKGRLR